MSEQPKPPNEDNNSTTSEPITDEERQEFTDDDDDDDRNHKHRKREARPESSANCEPSVLRPGKKRNRFRDNGSDFPSSVSNVEIQDQLKFRRHPGMTSASFISSDAGLRSKLNQPSRSDPPIARGRGRYSMPWRKHDIRYSHDKIDFASQGLQTHPSLFIGAGIPNGPVTQADSWGPFGFLPGMANGVLNPVNPLGFQNAFQPTLSPLMDLGLPRQRCRDFEELGFCLRGDMCPMEHGVNRIVVEDIQSLSQLNLPVPMPNQPTMLGFTSDSSILPPVSAPSSALLGVRASAGKDAKISTGNDVFEDSKTAASTAVETDVYDPDQPLWINEQLKTSGLRLAPNSGDGILRNTDTSAHGGIQSENPSNGISADVGSHSKPVQARINERRKKRNGKLLKGNVASTSTTGNQRTEVSQGADQGITRNITPEGVESAVHPNSRIHGESGRPGGPTFQKATCTLYVNCIPEESNRREALISHFRKFGEVVHVYIPPNSERAFVQFSKKEEAEAAIKAPDAVMGNRFIKLRWANRDGISTESSCPPHIPKVTGISSSSQSTQYQRGSQKLPAAAVPTSSIATPADMSLPSAGSAKGVPIRKKQESLEVLKELTKKHEDLAQKRIELLRQIDKFSKQSKKEEHASSSKMEEIPGKGQKIDSDNDNSGTTGPSVTIKKEEAQHAGSSISERNNQGFDPNPSTSKSNAAVYQKSLMLNKQPSAPALLQNRFKLDNRTTSFRILPPLPPEVADVSVLKDHFSSYGELSSVVLENAEAHGHTDSMPSLSCSACVIFTTRQSAESAFVNGKCCKGHMLRFMWLTAAPSSNGGLGRQTLSMPVRHLHESRGEHDSPGVSKAEEAMHDGGNAKLASHMRNGESKLASHVVISQDQSSSLPLSENLPHESGSPSNGDQQQQ